jgi:hypothetical protein
MATLDIKNPITEFWSLFRKRADELAVANSSDAPVYDELLACLHNVNPGLFFEFCADSQPRELIITAEGDRSLFRLAHALVAAAPPLPDWRLFALRPQLGFPETFRWDDLTLTTSCIFFDAVEDLETRELGLRIYIPGLDPSQTEDAHNGVLGALDHGLGEERHAESIWSSEVRALPHDADTSKFIPLTQLDAFLRQRSKRDAAN